MKKSKEKILTFLFLVVGYTLVMYLLITGWQLKSIGE